MTDAESPSTGLKPLRAAIVGCGRISDHHIAALKTVPGLSIVAVSDLDEGMARLRAERHGIIGVYTDAARMMTETRPDIVHLLTPPGSHRALVEIAAAHKVNAYVEKPFASNESDAVAMVAAARAAGIQLCPGHNRLFDPPFVEALRRVRAGEIGRVVCVRAEQGYAYEAVARSARVPWSYLGDWGVFENLIPHPLYMVTHFLREPGEPRVVGFNLGRIREAGVEEIRVLIPSREAVGEVTLSLTTAPVQNRVEIIGTDGRVMVDILTMSVVMQKKGRLPGFVARLTSGFTLGGQMARGSFDLGLGVVTGRVKQYMGLRALVPAFCEAIRAGQPSPITAEEGLLNVRLMDRIREGCATSLKARVSAQLPTAPGAEPRVLVTGATGFLGGRLVERLATDDTPARATARVLSRATPMRGVQWVACDLANDDQVRAALVGIDTVYHCAALAGAPGSVEEYEKANVGGTIRLATLAAEAGVRTFVYVSSISVYAMPQGSPWLDENSAYDTRAVERGAYTQSKLGADRAILEFASTHATPRIVVLRPGTIYGPGVKLPLGRFPMPIPLGARPIVAGDGRVPMPLTYVDNVIDAMRLGAVRDLPNGRVFNIIDEPELDQAKVAAILGELAGPRKRPRFMPYFMAWNMMLLIDLVSLARGRGMGTARYRLQRTLADMRYRSLAARQELGWEPKIATAEGLRRVVAAEKVTPYPY